MKFRTGQQKRSWRNIAQSKPVLILLGILVLIFTSVVLRFMEKMQATIENRKIAENKAAQLAEQKEDLSLKIAKLSTEEGKEESIRERFPVAKSGEGVIVIVEEKAEPKAPEKSRGGFFGFFRNLFR